MTFYEYFKKAELKTGNRVSYKEFHAIKNKLSKEDSSKICKIIEDKPYIVANSFVTEGDISDYILYQMLLSRRQSEKHLKSIKNIMLVFVIFILVVFCFAVFFGAI